MKEKTPQEKKALSYAKDCRNTYGESDKGSRKTIPKRKAEVNRSYRRKVTEKLKIEGSEVEPEIAEKVEASVRSIKRKDWKKFADAPLGKVVLRALERRAAHAGNGKTARKRAREFLAKLEIQIEQETDGRWIAEAVGMNGIAVYGDTEELALARCFSLAEVVFLESIDAVQILESKENGLSILLK